MKIAVVGSGISGLSASYILSSSNKPVKVTLFEKTDHIGFDAYSINFDDKRIDSPPRTFSKPFYNNLIGLYEDAGVEYDERVWNYTISFLNETSAWFKTGYWMLFNFRLPDFGNRLFDRKTWRMIYDALRFSRSIIKHVHVETYSTMTVAEYVKDYSEEFVYHALLPMLSMILTCSYQSILNYPILPIMRYMAVSGTKGQYATKYGTADAAQRLTEFVDTIHLNSKVTGIWHSSTADGKAKLEFMKNGQKEVEYFDHIVIASQASAVLNMVKNMSKEHEQIFQMFQHEFSDVVIHRDRNLMPTQRQDWSAANFIIDKEKHQAMTTLWATRMMDLNPKSVGDIFQTWNPIQKCQQDKALLQLTFERPIMTIESAKTIQLLQSIQGRGGIWYCGAYATYSVPLQESCVESAIAVAEQIGIQVAWKEKRWYDLAPEVNYGSTYSLFYVPAALSCAFLLHRILN